MEGIRLRSGSWDELQASCRLVRDEVFVKEQGVPVELEHDANDPSCIHVLASLVSGEAVGTGRFLPDGHIGRMAVRKAWRGLGVGGAMLGLLIEEARENGHSRLVLNAQLSAIEFYEGFGFVSFGERFFEAGIEHQSMGLNLND